MLIKTLHCAFQKENKETLEAHDTDLLMISNTKRPIGSIKLQLD